MLQKYVPDATRAIANVLRELYGGRKEREGRGGEGVRWAAEYLATQCYGFRATPECRCLELKLSFFLPSHVRLAICFLSQVPILLKRMKRPLQSVYEWSPSKWWDLVLCLLGEFVFLSFSHSLTCSISHC